MKKKYSLLTNIVWGIERLSDKLSTKLQNLRVELQLKDLKA